MNLNTTLTPCCELGRRFVEVWNNLHPSDPHDSHAVSARSLQQCGVDGSPMRYCPFCGQDAIQWAVQRYNLARLEGRTA